MGVPGKDVTPLGRDINPIISQQFQKPIEIENIFHPAIRVLFSQQSNLPIFPTCYLTNQFQNEGKYLSI